MTRPPRISIVTAVYNRANTIQTVFDCLKSQTFRDFEHIVVDGMSNDGTFDVIQQNKDSISQIIREPDDGIYDALNKGIRHARGEIVGLLHSDDLLAADHTLQLINQTFDQTELDAVYGDLYYVDAQNLDRILRYWKSGDHDASAFYLGWMPPHPTVYLRKSVYDRLGLYRTDIGSGADYELLVRFVVKNRIRWRYIPEVLVKMRAGGKSNESLYGRWIANRSDRDSWISNDLKPPVGLRFSKPFRKLLQFWMRPPRTNSKQS